MHFNVTTWKTGVGQEPDFTHGRNTKQSQMVVNFLFKSSNGFPLHPRLRTGLRMHTEIQDSSRIPHDLAPTGFQVPATGPNVNSSSLQGLSNMTAFSLFAMCLQYASVLGAHTFIFGSQLKWHLYKEVFPNSPIQSKCAVPHCSFGCLPILLSLLSDSVFVDISALSAFNHPH